MKNTNIETKEEYRRRIEKENAKRAKKEEKLLKKQEKINKKLEETRQLSENDYNETTLDNNNVEIVDSNVNETEDNMVKVVKQEDGTKQASKAKKIVIGTTAAVLGVAIICGSVYGLFNGIKKIKNNKKTEAVDDTNTSLSNNNLGKTISKTTSENSVSDNNIEEKDTINNDNSVQEVVDVNSEEYILEVADAAWNEILDERITNDNYAPSMDEDYIEELVKYVHHDEDGYIGLYNITNDNAYGNFFELAESDKVIGTLFTGLDSEEYMKNLNDKIANTVDNGDYKEEYEAFAAIEDAIDKVDLENVPESYAMMAMLDRYLGIKEEMEYMIFDLKDYTEYHEEMYKHLEKALNDEYLAGIISKDQMNEILDEQKREANKWLENHEEPEEISKWKMLYENLKKTNPNYIFANTWDIADKEDANMEEYNKAALEKMNSTETIETIYNETATDYDTVAQGFYNQIQSYRNQYGSFADEFTSVDDVKEFIIFVNQFKNPNMKSSINSLETFESMLQSYYNSCAVYGIDPNLSELFVGYRYAQDKLAESEELAARLKNGKGNDYSIANIYYKWMGVNLYMAGEINMSLKENAPLAITIRNQYSAYRLTGNMLNARKYQKTYDLGLGVDKQLVCPDSIDDYMINQTIPEGGHVINEENTYDTFGTAYDYIKNECKGLSK